MASKPKVFSTAPTVAVSAAGPMSDIPSKHPSNNGHEDDNGADVMDWSLTGLMAPRKDPDLDLITRTHALPRYLVEALRLESIRTHRPVQAIVADALRGHLPAVLQTACRDKELG